MSKRQLEPIERLSYEATRLFREHPPVIRDRNKQVVFEIACPEGSRHRGEIVYSRWISMPVPAQMDPVRAVSRVEASKSIYDYGPVAPGAVEWHVNFADSELFGFYATGLFAQDELQVAEHPILGSLKEALRASNRPRPHSRGGTPDPDSHLGCGAALPGGDRPES